MKEMGADIYIFIHPEAETVWTARTLIGIRDKSSEDVSFDGVAPQIIELINVEMIYCGVETRAGVVRKWLLSLKPSHQ